MNNDRAIIPISGVDLLNAAKEKELMALVIQRLQAIEDSNAVWTVELIEERDQLRKKIAELESLKANLSLENFDQTDKQQAMILHSKVYRQLESQQKELAKEANRVNRVLRAIIVDDSRLQQEFILTTLVTLAQNAKGAFGKVLNPVLEGANWASVDVAALVLKTYYNSTNEVEKAQIEHLMNRISSKTMIDFLDLANLEVCETEQLIYYFNDRIVELNWQLFKTDFTDEPISGYAVAITELDDILAAFLTRYFDNDDMEVEVFFQSLTKEQLEALTFMAAKDSENAAVLLELAKPYEHNELIKNLREQGKLERDDTIDLDEIARSAGSVIRDAMDESFTNDDGGLY